MDQSYLPVPLDGLALSKSLQKLSRRIDVILSGRVEPILADILKYVQFLGNKIGSFLDKVHDLLREKKIDQESRFIIYFFSRNFSIISQNARASKKIIEYVMNDMEWLNRHASRIVDVLKAMYAGLLALTIECGEVYRLIHSSELTFRFWTFNDGGDWGGSAEWINLESAYHVMGIDSSATLNTVKSTFRKLVKKYHPDLNPEANREDFLKLEQAYKRVLSVYKIHS